MICVKTLHVTLNRTMLLAVGLWPYQQSTIVRVQLALLFSILTSFIVFQLTALLTLECTPDLVIDVLSSTLFFGIFVVKYIWFGINTEVVKSWLEELQHIYNELRDENEIDILKKYGNYAQFYTATFLMLAMLLLLASALHIVWPIILNTFVAKNESWRPSLFLTTEYFIDKEKHLYLLSMHEHMAFIIGGFTMIATGAIIIVYIQHACGLFRIASYRLEQIMAIYSLHNSSLHKENLIFERLISAVEAHRKALQVSNSSISEFKVMFFCLIIFFVISESLNYFRVFRAMSYGFDIEKLIVPVTCVVILFSYMAIGFHLAQEVTDYNNDVFVNVYNIQWYLAPLRVQKMILFLLQKGTNTFYLTCGGIFIGSLETAATLVSTTVSYFTVLYSTRQ